MTYYGECEHCHQPVSDPQIPAFSVEGWEEPRAAGGTNHVLHRRRTGRVVHVMCLAPFVRGGEQEELAI